MSASAPTIYSGPARVALFDDAGTPALRGSFQADGEAGQVTVGIEQKVTKRASALTGYQATTIEDMVAKIGLTPFDTWSLLPILFPFQVAQCGATVGSLKIGDRPHDAAAGVINGNGATKIWTPSGTLLKVVRTAITKHPNMKLVAGKALFSGIEITGLADVTKAIDATDALIIGNAITESGGSDPDPTGFNGDFINGHWTGSWAVAGFGSGGTDPLLDSEDGWEIGCDVKYGMIQGSGGKRTWHMHLQSVEFHAKCKLIGPTLSTLLTKALGNKLGQRVGEATPIDLVLTGPQSKTITLKNCSLVLENSGLAYGGGAMTAANVSFITNTTMINGVVNPVIIFSA